VIGVDTFNGIIRNAKACKYSSMHFVEYADCANADVLSNCDDLVLLHDKSKQPEMIFFAADDKGVIKRFKHFPGKLFALHAELTLCTTKLQI